MTRSIKISWTNTLLVIARSRVDKPEARSRWRTVLNQMATRLPPHPDPRATAAARLPEMRPLTLADPRLECGCADAEKFRHGLPVKKFLELKAHLPKRSSDGTTGIVLGWTHRTPPDWDWSRTGWGCSWRTNVPAGWQGLGAAFCADEGPFLVAASRFREAGGICC